MIEINFHYKQTQLCLKYCARSLCLAAWGLLLGCGVRLANPSLTNISTLCFLYLSTWMLLMGPVRYLSSLVTFLGLGSFVQADGHWSTQERAVGIVF